MLTKYTLPPKYQAMRRTLARSHNRRVVMILLVVIALVFAALPLMRNHNNPLLFFVVLGCAGVFEIGGIIKIFRLARQQSIAVGFVCPLCSGSLYDGGDNRLGRRGECPRCKKFIITQLEQLETSRP